MNLHKDLFNIDVLDKLIKKYKSQIMFSPSAEGYLSYKIKNVDNVLQEAKKFLEFMGENFL